MRAPNRVRRALHKVKEIYLVLYFGEWWHWLVDTKAKRGNLSFHWLLFVAEWDSREIQFCQQAVQKPYTMNAQVVE